MDEPESEAGGGVGGAEVMEGGSDGDEAEATVEEVDEGEEAEVTPVRPSVLGGGGRESAVVLAGVGVGVEAGGLGGGEVMEEDAVAGASEGS